MKTILQTKDFAVSQEYYELRYNEELDMLYTHPAPADLLPYYQSDTYISHSDARSGLSSWLYQMVKKWSIGRKLNLLNSYATAGRNLLDVGAGTGDFVLAARKTGWHSHGTEPIKAARIRAEEKGLHLFKTLTDLPSEKFNAITLWHVLEHMPDLHATLDKLLAMLENDGTLMVAVPNFRSWDAKHYGAHWAAYDVPRHLWHFSRNSIEKLFSGHGFKVVRTHPLWFDAFYICLLSEKYRSGQTNFLRAFLNGLRSNWAARANKEYSSLIYVLQRLDKVK